MRKSKKKLLAIILAFTMVFGTLPSNVFANNEQEQIHAEIEETVTTDVSENVENENPVEDITEETQEEANTEAIQVEAKVEEETLSEVDSNTEVAVDSSLEKIKLEKTEEIKSGEKYIIVYDNKKALATGKDNIIDIPVEIEGKTVKTEITKNMVWTVDDNNNLVSELGKKLSAELTLLEHNGQSFEFNEKNVSYVNDEVNNYLTYNEENNKWSFNTEENEAVTYYNLVGPVEKLEELIEEELDKIEESNEVTETPIEGTEVTTAEGDNSEETLEDRVTGDIAADEEDVPTVISDVTGYQYVLHTGEVEAGEYLIVAPNTSKALMNSKGNVSSVDVILSENNTKAVINKTSDLNNSLWTFRISAGGFTIKNNNRYVNPTATYSREMWSYSLDLPTGNTTVSIGKNNDNYNYTISKNIKSDQQSTNSFLTYNDGFKASNSGTVRLYKRVEVNSTTDTENPIETVNFNATMYDYDGNKMNNTVSGDGLKFNFLDTNHIKQGNINTNSDSTVTQGIVKNKLDYNNNIQFSSGIAGPSDLFGTTSIEGKKVYNNVQFPFIYTEDDGYYTFDSSAYHVHVNTTNTEGQTLQLYTGQQTASNDRGSFFPFNNGHDKLSANYFFGMNMSIPIYIPEGGKDEITKSDIIFDFSGDDDVWVFIDGNLVLDLGGIHGVQGGTINFASGAISYTGNRRGISNENSSITLPTDLYQIIDEEYLQNGEEHSLQIFYLERGKGASNCKIRFNLRQKNKIEVSKSLVDGTPLTENNFKFTLQVKDGEAFVGAGEKSYKLYTGQGSVPGTYNTGDDGSFYLKAGQRAVFIVDDNDKGKEYRVVESTDGDYKTKWITYTNGNKQIETSLEDNQKASPSINIDGTNTVNTYSFYCYNQNDMVLEDDTIVIDYGKNVNINVMKNDIEKNPNIDLTLHSAKKDGTNEFKLIDNEEFSIELDNGYLTKSSEVDTDFTYSLYKYIDSIDRVKYQVEYSISGSEEKQYKAANLTIIPATTVYYEDNFTAIKEGNEYVSNGIKYSSDWIQVTTDDSGKITPTESFIGVIGNQDNGTVKSDGHPYGNDNSYKDDRYFSNGTAMKLSPNSTTTHDVVNGGEEKKRTASFEFVGTGFDLISLTDKTTGTIIVDISKYNTTNNKYEPVKKTLVNNEYDKNDKNDKSILYQIPVINFDGATNHKCSDKCLVNNKCTFNPYGMYKVDITVGDTNFYLDAIRVYNPLLLTEDNKEDYDDAYKQYVKDKEANAVITEVRNMLIPSIQYDASIAGENGFVFVDENPTAKLEDYINVGPNNEVYLAKGQAVSFKVPFSSQLETIQIGVKAPNGGSVFSVDGDNIVPGNTDITTATDMYYNIEKTEVYDSTKGGYVVVITNNSDNIISITNLKLTYATPQNKDIKSAFIDEYTVNMGKMLAYESSTNKSADINGDGTIDIYDLANVANNQNKEVIIGVSTDIYRQDLTGTRTINRDDLNIVRDNLQ